MPQNQDRKQRDFSRYDALSTEELSEILRLDSETPEGNGLDIDTLLYITGVLAERKKISSTGKTAQEAWKSFQQNYLDSEDTYSAVAETKKPVKTKRPWIRRMIAAAAALILLVSIPLTAKALNWEEICNTIVKWAKETFSFVTGDFDGTEARDHREFASLQEALEYAKFPTDMIPTWIPEGYVFVRVNIDKTPIQQNYVALYEKDEQIFNVSVRFLIETDPQKLEGNKNIAETYIAHGKEYYIITNNERISAMWKQDSYECYITGDLTVDEMKQMINSIPEG